jgi:hypothetical protein
MMTGKYPYRVGRQHMYIKPLMPVGLPVNVNIMPQYFKQVKSLCMHATNVADPDPASGAFLTPGTGIRNRFFPDPGSQTHIFEILVTS